MLYLKSPELLYLKNKVCVFDPLESFPLPPAANGNHKSVLCFHFLFFWIPHISGIIQYLSVCV